MVGIDIGGVDEIPFLVLLEVVDFWRPVTVGVACVLWWREYKFDFSGIPVCQCAASKECDVVLSCVGYVVVVSVEQSVAVVG